MRGMLVIIAKMVTNVLGRFPMLWNHSQPALVPQPMDLRQPPFLQLNGKCKANGPTMPIVVPILRYAPALVMPVVMGMLRMLTEDALRLCSLFVCGTLG